jgi:hypothetical protein
MIFQIFDDVELDIARAKYLERAARAPSSGVVQKCYAFHRLSSGVVVKESIGRDARRYQTRRAGL